MARARAPLVVLGLAEERQDVLPAPPDIAELAPVIVVGGLAAHVDHAVDRGAAADELAARVGEGAAVEALLCDGGIEPVGARIAHAVEVADRYRHPVVFVGTAGL